VSNRNRLRINQSISFISGSEAHRKKEKKHIAYASKKTKEKHFHIIIIIIIIDSTLGHWTSFRNTLLSTVWSSRHCLSCRIVHMLAVSNQRLYLLNKLKHAWLNLSEKGLAKSQAIRMSGVPISSLHATISVRHGSPRLNLLFRQAHLWQLTASYWSNLHCKIR